MVLEDHFGLVEQAPDQGALAIVHAAAGHEPQQAPVIVRLKIRLDVLGDEIGVGSDQKYPSWFFFSIEAAASWSMTRPCRSDDFVNSIS